MDKRAREKRERRVPPSAGQPSGMSPPSAPRRQRRQPRVGLAWPRWPGGGEAVEWRLVAAIFVIALIIRALFLSQITRTPYLELDTIDAKAYRVWAERILAGDWLPRRHFYQSPLYAYYLACVSAVFGRSPWAPRIIQVLLGSASAALLVVVGARFFNRRVGFLAGLLLATYGPLIVEEISLAKTALLIFGGLLAFVFYLAALDRSRTATITMAIAGVIFGVTIIGVGQWLPALLGLTAYAAHAPTMPRAAARRVAGVFLLGALLPLLPVIAWNSYWGGGLMLTSGDAGLNLYLGNNPRTTGLLGRPEGLRDIPEYEEDDSRRLAEREVGHPLTPAEVSRHWSQSATRWALLHTGPFIRTTCKKLLVLWNSYEIPDSYHFAFIRAQYIPALWGGSTFAIVGPLAIVGLALAAGHTVARPLYVICLSYLAVIALFYVRSRYRMPAVPFLIIFAAVTIDGALRMTRDRHWRTVTVIAATAVLASILVNHTYCEPAREKAPAICLGGDVWFDLEWQKIAHWYEQRGDRETALGYVERAARGESLRGPGQTYLWLGRLELELAQQAPANGGDTRSARLSRAATALNRAVRDGFHVYEAQTYLATVYQLQGQAERAIAASDAAMRARPRDPVVVSSALRVRAALGRCDDARRLREDLRVLRPNDPQADQIVAQCQPSRGG